MKKRAGRLLALGLSAVTVLALTACGGSSNEEAKNSEGKKEITIWVREQLDAPIKAVVEQYNQQSEDVEVKATVYPDKEFADQLTLALSSGTAPDIVSLDDVFAPYYESIDALADITEEFNELEYKDQFSEGMLELGQYEGKQYAIPFAPDVSVLLYNKDHFKEVGLDESKGPETWAELTEYAQKLTTNDRYGYTYAGGEGGSQMFTFMPYVWGNGGDILDDAGKKSLLDMPESIEALDFYDKLTNEYKVTPPGAATYSWSESQDAFLTGKASMAVLGAGQVYDFITNHPELNFGVSLIPMNEGKEHSSFCGGDNIAITKQSENKEEAWDFIQFALSEEAQVEVFAKNGLLPARLDMFENQYFEENPEFKVMGQALECATAPYTVKYNELYQPILTATQNCLLGDMSAEEAFTKGAEEITKIME